MVRNGITKVKITGGEPLIVKNIVYLIARIKEMPGVQEISLTTNGVFLGEQAQTLKNAGLDRVNISMDSLTPVPFQRITRRDCLDRVYAGLWKALTVGFDAVKLNVVPLRGVNDHEIPHFVHLAMDNPLVVRFIELFETNESSRQYADYLISNREIKERIQKQYGGLEKISSVVGDGPARYFQVGGTPAVIGFISNYSEYFCHTCTRLRMDARGHIFPCLFSYPVCDLKRLIIDGKTDEAMGQVLKLIIRSKRRFHKDMHCNGQVEMSRVGG